MKYIVIGERIFIYRITRYEKLGPLRRDAVILIFEADDVIKAKPSKT